MEYQIIRDRSKRFHIIDAHGNRITRKGFATRKEAKLFIMERRLRRVGFGR